MENEIEKLFVTGKVNELVQKPVISSNLHNLKTILINELNNPSSSSTNLTKQNLYNLNNLLTQWHSKQNLSLHSLLFTHARALDKILDQLSPHDHTSHPHLHNGNDGETTTEAFRWSNQYVDEESVYGIQDKGVFLRRLILPDPHEDDNVVFREFGLVGMQGIGKTTLAQMVFNHPHVKSYFLPRVWVCVSKQPGDNKDLKIEIVKRMLRSLGVEEEIITYADDKHKLKGLLYSLRQQLLGKRYLIVLDDVCNEDEDYLSFVSNLEQNIGKCKEKLAYGLPKECGGAVIVTGRSDEIVGKLVGVENMHRVLPLSDDDCWKIFKNNYLEEGESMSSDMESLEKKIKEKCYGLPLGAKMMAEIAKKPKAIPITTTTT